MFLLHFRGETVCGPEALFPSISWQSRRIDEIKMSKALFIDIETKWTRQTDGLELVRTGQSPVRTFGPDLWVWSHDVDRTDRSSSATRTGLNHAGPSGPVYRYRSTWLGERGNHCSHRYFACQVLLFSNTIINFSVFPSQNVANICWNECFVFFCFAIFLDTNPKNKSDQTRTGAGAVRTLGPVPIGTSILNVLIFYSREGAYSFARTPL